MDYFKRLILQPLLSPLQLWEVIQNLKSLTRHHYLIIRGKMGFGKSWLAMDACMDYPVIRSMDFQIFWVNVTKCNTPEGILQQMQYLKIMMQSTNHDNNYVRPEFESIQLHIIQMKKYFQNTFSSEKYKNSLLVLVNVQNKEVIEAFDFHCKVLATGRSEACFDEIPKNRKRFVVIDRGLTEQESLDFFDLMPGLSDTNRKYKMKVREIHKLCQGEPMIMSLIWNNIMQSVNPNDRLSNYIKKLHNNQLTDGQMDSTIEESLRVLDIEDREAYQKMVVFPQNVFVPVSVLSRYWHMTKDATEALVNRLYSCSLLSVDYRTDPNGERAEDGMFVSMHYIYSSYLRKVATREEETQMHLEICRSYEADRVLERRTEPELFDLPDDKYIHYYIGYHLQRSGLTHLFPLLYFDFGFLEQKLRYTGLPNTRGDLEEYRSVIVGDDEEKHQLWNELLDFLPTIEEMVHQNNDTSLLQYALNASDTIAKEAKRQVEKFSNRVWFDDVGHPAKQRRQMVRLESRPLVLKFYGPEAVLAALDDNSILLMDLSPSYVIEPTVLREHKKPIKSLETFGEFYLVSLDVGGSLLIWSLKDTPIFLAKCRDYSSTLSRSDSTSPSRRERMQEDSARKVRQHEVQNLNFRQAISRVVNENFINCFTIHESSSAGHNIGNGNGPKNGKGLEVQLICGTMEGVILFYAWCHHTEQFDFLYKINKKEHIVPDIRVLHYMAPICLMAVGRHETKFYNMTDTSVMYFTKPVKFESALAIHETPSLLPPNERGSGARAIYCVTRDSIVRMEMKRISGNLVDIHAIQEVYKANAGTAITCSTQSDDGKYLVLGTERGIVVFDCDSVSVWQRNSNGFRIACIDMCTCDDNNHRYVIMSGMDGDVVNIYGLPARRSIISGRTLSSDRSVFYGHSAKLLGENLFEVIENQRDDKDPVIIYAVETSSIVHKLSCEPDGVQGNAVTAGPWKKITCTGQWSGNFCFGTIDGKFYVVNQDSEQYQLVTEMKEAIVYIKGIQPNYCIVGTENNYKVLRWGWNDSEMIVQTGKVVDGYSVGEERILIVRRAGPVQLLEMDRPVEARIEYLSNTAANEAIVGCEYQADTLVLLDVLGKIRFFTVDKNQLEYELVAKSWKDFILYRISAMALSKDASLFAVGNEMGKIYVSIRGSRDKG